MKKYSKTFNTCSSNSRKRVMEGKIQLLLIMLDSAEMFDYNVKLKGTLEETYHYA